MAVKSSGPLSLTEIQAEFGGSAPISLSEYYRGGAYVPNGPTQNAGIATSGAINMGSFYGSMRGFTFSQTLAANTNNYNLRAAAIAAGWDQSAPLFANITINSGVIVGSTSTGAWAFDTGASFPAGSTLALVNNGTIQGMGGAGGGGGSNGAGGTGGAGGPALRAQAAISVTNNGSILGGGGGGGGGGAATGLSDRSPISWIGGNGGGGGRGANGGGGGGHGGWDGVFPTGGPNNGSAGSSSSGGGGGSGGTAYDNVVSKGGPETVAMYAGAGGAGGGAGSSGSNGSAGSNIKTSGNVPPGPVYDGGAGGAGGAAVTGNAYITWVATGTRLGAIS